MNSALWGFSVGLGVALLARWTRFDRDKSFYPTVLIVIAFYYVLFAILYGSERAILTQVVIATAFCAIAIAGRRIGVYCVAAGIAAHGVYDFAYATFGIDHGAPQWWPVFCGVIDIILGAAAVAAVKLAPRRDSPSS